MVKKIEGKAGNGGLLADLDPDTFVEEDFFPERGIMAKKTAQGKRLRKEPPRYYKVGKSVRYRVGDIIEWLQAHRVEAGA